MDSYLLNDWIEYDPKLRVRKPILKVDAFVSEIVCYEPGQATATHHHPVQDEIWVVLEGRGEIWVGDERLAVQRSSLILIPAGIRHGLQAAPDSRLVLLFVKSPGITEAEPGSTAAALAAASALPWEGGTRMRSFVLDDLVEYDPKLRVRKPILKVPTLVSEIVCYEPGQATATHHHPVQDELWLVLEGRGEIWVGDARRAVERSSLILIPAGIRHGLQAAPDSRLVLLFVKSPGITEAAVAGAAAPGAGAPPIRGERLLLEVTDIQAEARDVIQVELRAPGGAELPAFEPGAHLAIGLPNGLLRHYSLANDWRERDRYVIGVARAAQGRGGPQFIHQTLRRGMQLATSTPKNGFPLEPTARRYLFLAGGIGVTPVLAMIRWCAANQRPWRLAYAVRSAQRAAFLETLSGLGGGTVHLHADDREAGVFDPAPWLDGAGEGEHVYCCGPAPMMAAVKAAAAHRDPNSVHFEYFAAPTDDHPGLVNQPFEVELRRSGKRLAVPADRSLLQVLEEVGAQVISSCREGTCRTCETAVCAGEIDHRDYCLTPAEQAAGNTMLVCVSRAKSATLVLDL